MIWRHKTEQNSVLQYPQMVGHTLKRLKRWSADTYVWNQAIWTRFAAKLTRAMWENANHRLHSHNVACSNQRDRNGLYLTTMWIIPAHSEGPTRSECAYNKNILPIEEFVCTPYFNIGSLMSNTWTMQNSTFLVAVEYELWVAAGHITVQRTGIHHHHIISLVVSLFYFVSSGSHDFSLSFSCMYYISSITQSRGFFPVSLSFSCMYYISSLVCMILYFAWITESRGCFPVSLSFSCMYYLSLASLNVFFFLSFSICTFGFSFWLSECILASYFPSLFAWTVHPGQCTRRRNRYWKSVCCRGEWKYWKTYRERAAFLWI